ncbi:hypothetical protein [Geothrix fermentans]|uniref:hypothetical protein n=1 Tax=Geothrix fermentans TaxID=44676 RepID=UPI000417287F|nr:hypothetical protein [Geothrix fermentans]
MHRPHPAVVAALILLSTACAPLVSTHAKAPGVQITSECFTEGGETFVRLGVVAVEEGAPWLVEFAEGAPEKLVVEVNQPLTRIRWKVGRDRFKALGIAPYELRLSSGDRAFKVTVAFRTTSQQVIGAFIQTVASLH